MYDISGVGYQQFDLIDTFDMLENPEELEDLDEIDRARIRELHEVSFKGLL